MKKIIINSIICVWTATLAVSCASTVKVRTDYDRSANFAVYKSFSFYNLSTTPDVNVLNAKRILNSITSEMIKKGYTMNDTNPDLMINVVGLLKDKKSISASGNGLSGPYGNWPGTDAIFQTNQHKDGFLLIHILDGNTNWLLWEGIGNAAIAKLSKNQEEAISKAVAKIMNAFPQRRTD